MKRKLVTQRLKKLEAEKMRIRLLSLCKNGNFTSWDNIMSSDISWNDMIYDLSENVLAFRINAISCCLPSLLIYIDGDSRVKALAPYATNVVLLQHIF